MVQLYNVALTAGKAHKDHKHHHAHHYEHDTSNNTPRTTTQAPVTGPPLPPHPFLTGGQINTQVQLRSLTLLHPRGRVCRIIKLITLLRSLISVTVNNTEASERRVYETCEKLGCFVGRLWNVSWSFNNFSLLRRFATLFLNVTRVIWTAFPFPPTCRYARLSMNISCVRTNVPGKDQSRSADSDRTKRPNHSSSSITTGTGIAPAAASALESRCFLDSLPSLTDTIH